MRARVPAPPWAHASHEGRPTIWMDTLHLGHRSTDYHAKQIAIPAPFLIPFVRTPENTPNQTEYRRELLRLRIDEPRIVE